MLSNRFSHLSLAAALIASMAVPAAPAAAANTVQCWKVVFSRPCVELIVGDTEAGLPTAGVPEGASAWATDSGRLVCFSGSAWGPCNDTGGGGLSSTDLDTSSELRALVTDETGTGALMFGLTAAMQNDIGCTASQGVRRNSGDSAWECFTPGSASGTVTNVEMAVPSGFTLSGSPVTTSGTFTLGLSSQTANTVWAGPTTGGAAAPTFRALVSADIPDNAANTSGTAASFAANPADCTGADNEFGWRIAANGDLSCASVNAEKIRPSSINQWPASAGPYDDEFTSTTLSGSWAVSATSGNSTSAGSISLLASPSAPVYDLTTVPGWLMWQSDASGSGAAFVRSWTDDTTSLLFARCQQDQRNYSASQEGSVHIGFTVSTDSNESVFMWANTAGNLSQFRLQVQNNGVFTQVITSNLPEITPLAPFILLLVRATNSYYGFVSFSEGSSYTYLGTVTKTGVGTWDEIRLVFLGADETPSPIMGCDYIRAEGDNVFPAITR